MWNQTLDWMFLLNAKMWRVITSCDENVWLFFFSFLKCRSWWLSPRTLMRPARVRMHWSSAQSGTCLRLFTLFILIPAYKLLHQKTKTNYKSSYPSKSTTGTGLWKDLQEDAEAGLYIWWPQGARSPPLSPPQHRLPCEQTRNTPHTHCTLHVQNQRECETFVKDRCSPSFIIFAFFFLSADRDHR